MRALRAKANTKTAASAALVALTEATKALSRMHREEGFGKEYAVQACGLASMLLEEVGLSDQASEWDGQRRKASAYSVDW